MHVGGDITLCVCCDTCTHEKKNRRTHTKNKQTNKQESSKCPLSSRGAVKCNLTDNLVEVSGGGLGANYSTLQLHFHWGSTEHPGSEHKVNGKRYAMEVKLHTCYDNEWAKKKKIKRTRKTVDLLSER